METSTDEQYSDGLWHVPFLTRMQQDGQDIIYCNCLDEDCNGYIDVPSASIHGNIICHGLDNTAYYSSAWEDKESGTDLEYNEFHDIYQLLIKSDGVVIGNPMVTIPSELVVTHR